MRLDELNHCLEDSQMHISIFLFKKHCKSMRRILIGLQQDIFQQF